MTDQTRNQPVEMEAKARIIGRKLKQLQQKCANHAEMKSISIVEIEIIMRFMAKELTTDHRHLFQDHFIGHLEIFSELSQLKEETQTDKFTCSFKKITETLCEVISNKLLPAKYLCHLLKKWLQCLDRIPCEQRNRVFEEIGPGLRQNCGRFLIEASCYSMQQQMLDIILSYSNGGISKSDDDPAMKPLRFLKVFSGVINNLENDDLVKAAVGIFKEKTSPEFHEKHRMLDLLNGFTTNRSIHSMPIKSFKMKIVGKIMQECDSGWMHLNIVSGTIEFSLLPIGGELKTLCIKPHKLEKIQIIESAETSSVEVNFMLISKSQHESVQKKQSKSIEVVMVATCVKSELITRLGQVFPAIDLEDIQNDSNNNSDVSKISKTTSVCNELKGSIHAQKSAAIRKVPTLAQESTFYDIDDAIIEPTQPAFADEDLEEIQREFTVYGDQCAVDIQNSFVSTTRKRAANKATVQSEFKAAENKFVYDFGEGDYEPMAKKPRGQGRGRGAPKQSESKPVKSIDADKLRVYDFDMGDNEPVVKKPSGRGRGRGRPRGTAQPKKRAKPAPFPRVKKPPVNQREIKYTVRAKIPVGPSAKALNTAKNPNLDGIDQFAMWNDQQMSSTKTRAQRKRTSYFANAVPSGMDKLGMATKSHLITKQTIGQSKQESRGLHKTNKMNMAKTTTDASLKCQQSGDGMITANDISDIIDCDYNMDVENIDANAKRCRCHDENLKYTITNIRDAADRALHILQTFQCTCCA